MKQSRHSEILDKLSESILKTLDASQKMMLSKALEYVKNKNVNVLLVGGSRAGKSSTINALFNEKVAKTGFIDPVTKTIEKYELGNLTLWRSKIIRK